MLDFLEVKFLSNRKNAFEAVEMYCQIAPWKVATNLHFHQLHM